MIEDEIGLAALDRLFPERAYYVTFMIDWHCILGYQAIAFCQRRGWLH